MAGVICSPEKDDKWALSPSFFFACGIGFSSHGYSCDLSEPTQHQQLSFISYLLFVFLPFCYFSYFVIYFIIAAGWLEADLFPVVWNSWRGYLRRSRLVFPTSLSENCTTTSSLCMVSNELICWCSVCFSATPLTSDSPSTMGAECVMQQHRKWKIQYDRYWHILLSITYLYYNSGGVVFMNSFNF